MKSRQKEILLDGFGRKVNNLRISVTDRCNFRCRYCMPEDGTKWFRKHELLSFEEIARLVQLFAELGISHIRLTGGEPLMRRDLHVLVGMVAAVKGIVDIALTTNGFFLAEQAESLVSSGLCRINVSLDSLDPMRFSGIVRRDYMHEVNQGLEAAGKLGLRPIKLNVVLMRGVNDNEMMDFVRLAESKPYVVRFIEFMPVGPDNGWSMQSVIFTKEIIGRMKDAGVELHPIGYRGAQPACRYSLGDGRGEVGFISPVSDPFCSSCNRVRITSDGKLRACLFSSHETDLKQLLRNGAPDEEIKNVIAGTVLKKEAGHLINRQGFRKPERTMSQIGG